MRYIQQRDFDRKLIKKIYDATTELVKEWFLKTLDNTNRKIRE